MIRESLDRGECPACRREALDHEEREGGVVYSCRACGEQILIRDDQPPAQLASGDPSRPEASAFPLRLPDNPDNPAGIRTNFRLGPELYCLDIYDGDTLVVIVEAKTNTLHRVRDWLLRARELGVPKEAITAYLHALRDRDLHEYCPPECPCLAICPRSDGPRPAGATFEGSWDDLTPPEPNPVPDFDPEHASSTESDADSDPN